MQQLHLVGLTTDLGGLILSARRGTKSGSYVIPLDDNLLAVLEDALRRRDGEQRDDAAAGSPVRPRTRQQSALTPREIQARLRAGRSMSAVAKEAGVTEDWVLRFAIPILAEQAQILDRARSLHFSTPRRGQSSQPLGTSVLWNLVDRGVLLEDGEFDRAWTAFQARNGSWVIRFTYVSRKRQQRAEWEFDPQEQLLLPINRLATDLGYVEPGRRLRKIPRPDAQPATATAKPSAREAAASKGATAAFLAQLEQKKKAATKRAAPSTKSASRPSGAAKRPSGAKKTAAKKTAAKKTESTRAGAKKAVPKRAGAKKVAGRTASARRTATKRVAAKKKARPAPRPAPRGATPVEAAPPRRAVPPAATGGRARPVGAARRPSLRAASGDVPTPVGPRRDLPPASPPIHEDDVRPLQVAAVAEPEVGFEPGDAFGQPEDGATPTTASSERELPTVVIRTNQAAAASPSVAAFPRPQAQASELPVLERPRPKRLFRRRSRSQ